MNCKAEAKHFNRSYDKAELEVCTATADILPVVEVETGVAGGKSACIIVNLLVHVSTGHAFVVVSFASVIHIDDTNADAPEYHIADVAGEVDIVFVGIAAFANLIIGIAFGTALIKTGILLLVVAGVVDHKTNCMPESIASRC